MSDVRARRSRDRAPERCGNARAGWMPPSFLDEKVAAYGGKAVRGAMVSH